MNLGFVWLSAMKDIRRRLRDPLSLVFSLGMPLIIVGLILLAFGGQDGSAPTAKVVVVDQDEGFVSGMVVQAMGQVEVIQAELAPAEEARKRLDDGKVTAMLTIPKGFGKAFFDATPTTLELRTNPAQRILPGIVEETLGILTDAGFYAQQVFGEELRSMSGGVAQEGFGIPDDVFSTTGSAINRKISRVGQYANPPLIDVKTTVDSTSTGPRPNLGALFFPGVLFMALLFMAGGIAGDVWVEKESGTLRRIVSSPQHLTDFLAGKILSGTMLMAGTSLAALLIGVPAVGVHVDTIPLAMVWAAFSGTIFLIAITLIYLFAASAQTAGVLSTMIIFPLLMVGGSFFPFEAMPKGLAAIGRMTPNGWALTQFKAITAGTADPAALGLAFLGLLIVGVVAFFLAASRLRRGFVTA